MKLAAHPVAWDVARLQRLGVAAGLFLAVVAAVTAEGATTTRLEAQVLPSEPDILLMAPFFGLLLTSDVPRSQQAIGAHLTWSPDRRHGLAARYEWRWSSRVEPYDAGSLDVIRRIVGGDTAMIALTGGWARWGRRDHATLGLRAAWPFLGLDEDGSANFQAWVDIRYAVPSTSALRRREGVVWTHLMITYVVPMRWVGRRRSSDRRPPVGNARP